MLFNFVNFKKFQNIQFKLLASLTEIRLRNFNFKFKTTHTTLEH